MLIDKTLINVTTEQVFIGIGSNIGDSANIVCEAIAALGRISITQLTHQSSLYRSQPMSDIPQDDYTNAIASVRTGLHPIRLLLELQAIERAYYRQRNRHQKWAPRTLDLDVILFGDQIINNNHLIVPHPHMSDRLFVLTPLFEITGDRSIPGLGNLSDLIDKAQPLDIEKL